MYLRVSPTELTLMILLLHTLNDMPHLSDQALSESKFYCNLLQSLNKYISRYHQQVRHMSSQDRQLVKFGLLLLKIPYGGGYNAWKLKKLRATIKIMKSTWPKGVKVLF